MRRPRLSHEEHNSGSRFNGPARHGIGYGRKERGEGGEPMAYSTTALSLVEVG
jgi:hypothetical protein